MCPKASNIFESGSKLVPIEVEVPCRDAKYGMELASKTVLVCTIRKLGFSFPRTNIAHPRRKEDA